jgi:hypothetical protein
VWNDRVVSVWLVSLVVAFVIGLATGAALQHRSSASAAPQISASAALAPAVPLTLGTRVAKREGTTNSAVPHALPKGVRVTDRGSVTFDHPKCSEPVSVACTVVEERDGGRRLVFDVPGGTITDASHDHVIDLRRKDKPWRVLAVAGFEDGAWHPGAEVGRAIGPFEIAAGTIPGVVDAYVGFGFRY